MRTLFITYALLVSIAIAQEHDPMGDDKWDREDEHGRRERMETMMVWRLTEELDLKPKQAEKFFPRFREHRKNLSDIHKEQREIGKRLRQKIGEDEKISKSEVTSAVKEINLLRKKTVDVEEKFLLGRADLLDPLQLSRLGMFKQEMLREMGGELRKRGNDRKKMKKRKGGHRKRGQGRRGFWN